MLSPRHVCPVVEHYGPQDGSVDYSLGKGWVQSPSEQEDHSPEIPFPLHNVPKVVEHCDIGIKVLSLHLNG